MIDSGSTEWPSDELLSAELGAVVSSKRQCSSLVAVRDLVTSFVLAHNRLVCELASARDQNHRLRQEVDRLKLELSPLITLGKVDERLDIKLSS